MMEEQQLCWLELSSGLGISSYASLVREERPRCCAPGSSQPTSLFAFPCQPAAFINRFLHCSYCKKSWRRSSLEKPPWGLWPSHSSEWGCWMHHTRNHQITLFPLFLTNKKDKAERKRGRKREERMNKRNLLWATGVNLTQSLNPC